MYKTSGINGKTVWKITEKNIKKKQFNKELWIKKQYKRIIFVTSFSRNLWTIKYNFGVN